MEPFTTLSAVAVPLDTPNMDTDQIIPARYLGKPRPAQVEGLFRDLRYQGDGTPHLEFPLNQPRYTEAKIVVAGRNFGCGSSREQAVTVLVDNGFRAFIAQSFGDIFTNNCFQNGVLPIRLPANRVEALLGLLHASPDARITISLEDQTVIGPDGMAARFEIDSFRKDCLLRGVDEVSLTLSSEADIARFEARRRCEQDWL
jgi:3-isopropylmalate/(R)-2-methylmalate dehydratase small subunit